MTGTNIVSKPPLTEPISQPDGIMTRVWSVWFRDLYRRTSYQGGNAIDDNLDVIEGAIDTLEEAVYQILTNVIDIQENADDLIGLEHSVLGQPMPDDYETAGISYVVGDFVVHPGDDPLHYYQCKEDIASPAGPFDIAKWQEVSLEANLAYIDLTRQQSIDTFVSAGYGGIASFAHSAIGTIDSTFKVIAGFDTDIIAAPFNVSYDKPSSAIGLDTEGLWEITAHISLSFLGGSVERSIAVGLYVAASSTTADQSTFTVPRNTSNMTISATLLIDMPLANIGEFIDLRIGSTTDTLVDAVNTGTRFIVKHIGQRTTELGT